MTFKPFTGPKSQEFKDPDTGRQYKADTREELIIQIRNYRKQNKLPEIEYLDDVIDHYLCMLPENQVSCQDANVLSRNLRQYVKGGIVLLRELISRGGFRASQEVADKRASICIECKYNVFPDKKGFLAWSDKLTEDTLQGRRSKYHEYLGNCQVCSCLMKTKVFYSGKLKLTKEEIQKMKSVDCWQPELIEDKS